VYAFYIPLLIIIIIIFISSSSLFEIRPQGSIKQYTLNIKTDTGRKENTVQ